MDTLRIYFVTWNVATKSPSQDLNALLDFPSQFNKNKPLPDFYVIGLQEVKSQPQNMIMDSLFTDSWTSTFNKILCRQGYIVAKLTRLQGLLLLVYTQMKHVTHLRDIEAQYTKTGLGGMWGNKGAVSIRFNIYGCSVCLVNSHLTAHEHLLADRINDYNTIIKQHQYHVSETANILYHEHLMGLKRYCSASEMYTAAGVDSFQAIQRKRIASFMSRVDMCKNTIIKSLADRLILSETYKSYVFWIGDLNFRTDHPSGNSPTSEEIVATLQKVEKDKYNSLLAHDQLKAVMESGEAFAEFSESEIRFPPTYKFLMGGDVYDMKRKPSWTDRILHKVIVDNYENIKLRADLITYNHIPHYTLSDHKPVIAQFNIKIRSGFTRSLNDESPRAARSAIRMRSAMFVAPEVEERVQDSSAPATSANDVTDSAFANYTEKTVDFATANQIWYIGDADFKTQCTLSPDVEVNSNDWIGIYDADFHNLDDYIAYEYLAKVSIPNTSPTSGQPRSITLSFPLGSGIRTPGFYRFIYFSQPNNDVKSVLGISQPFEVSSKEEQQLSAELESTASGSSPSRTKPSTATTDIFTDFTGLDVANLSRHFSNDLSID